MSRLRLSDLPIHASGVISKLDLSDMKRSRLEDLGFCPDVNILHVYTAPAGSPMAFLVKGAVIALRVNDCKRIFVERNV